MLIQTCRGWPGGQGWGQEWGGREINYINNLTTIKIPTPQENLFESPQEEVAVTNVYCKIGTDQIKIVAPKRGIPAAGPELI